MPPRQTGVDSNLFSERGGTLLGSNFLWSGGNRPHLYIQVVTLRLRAEAQEKPRIGFDIAFCWDHKRRSLYLKLGNN
jgi:hypothetical protein